jgi:WD40 repeat protein
MEQDTRDIENKLPLSNLFNKKKDIQKDEHLETRQDELCCQTDEYFSDSKSSSTSLYSCETFQENKRVSFYSEFKKEFPDYVRENKETLKHSKSLEALVTKKISVKKNDILEEIREINDSIAKMKEKRRVLKKTLAELSLMSNSSEDNYFSRRSSTSSTGRDSHLSFLNSSHSHSSSPLTTLVGHKLPVTCIDFEHFHEYLASGSEDGTIKIWDLGSWKLLRSLNISPLHAIRTLEIRDGLLVSGGDDREIHIFSLPEISSSSFEFLKPSTDTYSIPFLRSKCTGHLSPIKTLKYDSSYIISGDEGNNIMVWDINTSIRITSFRNDDNNELDGVNDENIGVWALQFYENALATGGADGIVRLWDIRMQCLAPIRRLASHTLPVKCLQFGNGYLMSGSLDRTLRIVDLRMGKIIESYLSKEEGGIMDFQYDENKIIAAGGDENIHIIDRKSKAQYSFQGHQSTVRSLKFSASSLVTAGDDCVIKLWNLPNNRV